MPLLSVGVRHHHQQHHRPRPQRTQRPHTTAHHLTRSLTSPCYPSWLPGTSHGSEGCTGTKLQLTSLLSLGTT
ncbi:hypothetical protein E2C01_045386 [Portunus trituberculatus]|uniref:Uncharacterized protein n=1 Tax=Portunus trituberculatus TaxID=210409 RepID=A0A5B7G321_PORTR|nr:hypothetical protein [Portunus trituberculatus]